MPITFLLIACLAFTRATPFSPTRKPTRFPTIRTPKPSTGRIKLCPGHPDIDATLARSAPSYNFPTSHSSVHPLLAPHMPSGLSLFLISPLIAFQITLILTIFSKKASITRLSILQSVLMSTMHQQLSSALFSQVTRMQLDVR